MPVDTRPTSTDDGDRLERAAGGVEPPTRVDTAVHAVPTPDTERAAAVAGENE